MNSKTYIVREVLPSAMPVLQPMAVKIDEYADRADLFGVTPEHAYTNRLLDAAADVYSRWFIVMRAAVSRERMRQRMHCKEMGLPVKTTKLEYEKPALTESEIHTVSLCSAIIKSLFNPHVAEYAMMKFQKAINTGDKRSFKIRLLILRSRDSLKGTILYDGFCDGAEECISKAEQIAGCVPDPSPRRMSKAEQAKAIEKKNQPRQPLLFDCLLDSDNSTEAQQDIDNIDKKQPDKMLPSNGGVNSTTTKVTMPPIDPDMKNKKEAKANLCSGSMGGDGSDSSLARRVSEDRYDGKNRPFSKTEENKNKNHLIEDKCVTVTLNDSEGSGYLSNEDVISDLRNGNITPAQAVVFLSEIAKRKRYERINGIGEAVSRDIDSRIGMNSEDQALCKRHISISNIDDEDLADDEDIEDMDEDENEIQDDMYDGDMYDR